MHLDHYEIILRESGFEYEFLSVGPKGAVPKAVAFEPTNLHNFFNLGFGDLAANGQSIDNLAVTDNGDTAKVLVTDAVIVAHFTECNHDAMIFATGSTPARTRLYRMGITTHQPLLEAAFRVFGYCDGAWGKFEKGADYEAFYVQRKPTFNS